jgi:hypothetical protein
VPALQSEKGACTNKFVVVEFVVVEFVVMRKNLICDADGSAGLITGCDTRTSKR